MLKPNINKPLLHLAKAELELVDIKKGCGMTTKELSLINSVIHDIRSTYRYLRVIDEVWASGTSKRDE